MRGLEGENPKELDTAKAVFQAAEAAEEKRPMLFGPVSPCAEHSPGFSWKNPGMDLISSCKKSSRLGAVLPIRLGWLSGWLL